MAQKIEVQLIDDLDGSMAVETVEFSYGGVDYAIDLNEENAFRLNDILRIHAEKARRVGKRKGRSSVPGTPKNTDASKMREWIRSQGHQIADRGRIPNEWVEKYQAAQNAPVVAPEPQEAPKPKPAAKKTPAKAKSVAAASTTLGQLLKFEEPKPTTTRKPRATTSRAKKSTTT